MLPAHKTKIVATIALASESPEMLERLIRAGMNVARLNFSHGDFSKHGDVITRIRAAGRAVGRRVAIMADLPGAKMRIGELDPEPIELRSCDRIALTTEDIVGTSARVSMSFARLPRVVKPGDRLFLIAKIERSGALQHFEEILTAADGIMVARGDLGVEVPLEEIAMTQKQLLAKASLAGKPVIIATQMLESMVSSRLPTCAEATDVANVILDGTDCFMLSAESALGRYPEEAVAMLAKIAGATEARRPPARLREMREICHLHPPSTAAEAIASVVEHALETVPCAAMFVPTHTGTTARMISRFKPSAWIAAFSRDPAVCQGLAFSYGVHPVDVANEPDHWREFATRWLQGQQVPGLIAMLVAGPSTRRREANHRIEFMRIDEMPATGPG